MDRRAWDQLVSGAGVLVAVVLLVIGGAAVYGGNFGRDNVQDELKPQNISFAPADALTPEEREIVGDNAGAKVDTGPEAKVFAGLIGLHLEGINEGKTYSETSSEARALDPEDPAKAELDAKVMTLFRGETLRGLLLNAYGWWTVSTLALFAGYGLVAAGIILAILAALGFRHARKVSLKVAERPAQAAA